MVLILKMSFIFFNLSKNKISIFSIQKFIITYKVQDHPQSLNNAQQKHVVEYQLIKHPYTQLKYINFKHTISGPPIPNMHQPLLQGLGHQEPALVKVEFTPKIKLIMTIDYD